MMLGGLPVLSMSVAGAAQPYLDAVILSKLAPAAAVGYYGAARNILGTLLAPAVILGTASYPRISRAAHHASRSSGQSLLLAASPHRDQKFDPLSNDLF